MKHVQNYATGQGKYHLKKKLENCPGKSKSHENSSIERQKYIKSNNKV